MKATLLIVIGCIGLLSGCCSTGGCGGASCAAYSGCSQGDCNGACSSSGNDPYTFGLWSSENHACGSTGIPCCCFFDNVGSYNFPDYPRD